MDSTRRNGRSSGTYVGAAILIVVGLLALVANLGGSVYVGQSIPLAIGAAFLVAYAMTRQYGFLVPGGILAGVGAGIVASSWLNTSDGGPYIAIGGGLGFLLIFAIDMLVSGTATRWWPVIPGGLMVVAGSAGVVQNQLQFQQLAVWSPVLLIVLGVLLLLTRSREQRR